MRQGIQLIGIDISNRHVESAGQIEDFTNRLFMNAMPQEDDLELPLPRLERGMDGLSAFQVFHRRWDCSSVSLFSGVARDAFDAVVCAVVARAAALGRTSGPPRELADVASREGWIHLPTGPLDALR